MTSPVRLAFADDSVTLRRMLTDVFSSDPELQICLAARDGQEMVTQYSKVKPDIVLLDVEMPVMDGIEAAAAIRRLDPRVPIIMFSTLTSNGAEATFDALTNGATDYVRKPTNCGHMNEVCAYLRNELIPKIKHWGGWFQRTRQRQMQSTSEPAVQSPKTEIPRKKSVIEAVAIGVSTGGPVALAELLKDIPSDFPVPILIAQHMPVTFTKLLAERLSHICPLHVREGIEGALLEPGHVWIAPGDFHMETKRIGTNVRIHLHQGPQENSCRPSVDVLLRSVASSYRDRALAVILTGMGQDGMLGCQSIHESGGCVLAQDEASCVVWGMPRAVTKAGLADRIVPLSQMAHEITRIASVGHGLSSVLRTSTGHGSP